MNSGEPIELVRRGPGEYVGEMAVISEEPRMASLIAAEGVRALYIDKSQFRELLRRRPQTSLAVIEVLCERLRETVHMAIRTWRIERAAYKVSGWEVSSTVTAFGVILKRGAYRVVNRPLSIRIKNS